MKQGQRPISLHCTLIFLRPMALRVASFNSHLSPGRNTMLSLFHLIFQLNKKWSLILTTPISCWISVAKRETDHTGKGRGFIRQGISACVYRQDWLTQQILLGGAAANEEAISRLAWGLLSLSCMQKCKALLPGADGKMGPISSYSSGSLALQICERASLHILVM